MALYTLSDTHLSFQTEKPMDIFGTRWQNHADKIARNWQALITENDTVVIPGDITWAMTLQEAVEDFRFLSSLPGKKIIGKGNHDYWWQTRKKVEEFFLAHNFTDISLLYGDAIRAEDKIICGTRGWFFEEERSGQHDEKVFKRELIRLEASLKAAGDRKKMVFLHYPPRYKGYECREILDLFQQYGVRQCYYGHLHGGSHRLAMEGLWDSVEFHLVAADYIGFKPVTVIF